MQVADTGATAHAGPCERETPFSRLSADGAEPDPTSWLEKTRGCSSIPGKDDDGPVTQRRVVVDEGPRRPGSTSVHPLLTLHRPRTGGTRPNFRGVQRRAHPG